jgi:ferric-chelate reductase
VGYVILVQSLLHAIGWTIVEARLYQPQPSTGQEWIKQTYMVWGCVAVILLTIMWVLTFPVVIRRTGYEFFRKAHYVLAMIFIGACWGHWEQLKCFLIPSLALWAIDRGVRLARTFLLHYNLIAMPDGTTLAGFRSTKSNVQLFADPVNGDVVRLDFDQQQTSPWHVGQHYFITFSDHAIWQSHPFTPLSLPRVSSDGFCRHSYVFRAKTGETSRVARAIAEQEDKATSLILTGPYGGDLLDKLRDNDNVLCVAGGTGITFVLPVLTFLCTVGRYKVGAERRIALIWVVRHATDVEWVQPELDVLAASGIVNVVVHSTRDAQTYEKPLKTAAEESDASRSSSEPEIDVEKVKNTTPAVEARTANARPSLASIVEGFVYGTAAGSTTVFASGPGSMTSDLRDIVARKNDAQRALRGQENASVRLYTDERLEW